MLRFEVVMSRHRRWKKLMAHMLMCRLERGMTSHSDFRAFSLALLFLTCWVYPTSGGPVHCFSPHRRFVPSRRMLRAKVLDPFYIEVNYLGTWTAARQAVFQNAADR